MKLRAVLLFVAMATASCQEPGWFAEAPPADRKVETSPTPAAPEPEPEAPLSAENSETTESSDDLRSLLEATMSPEKAPEPTRASAAEAAAEAEPSTKASPPRVSTETFARAGEIFAPVPAPEGVEFEPGTVIVRPDRLSLSGLAEAIREAAGTSGDAADLARKVDFLCELDRDGAVPEGDESTEMILDAAGAIAKWTAGEHDPGYVAMKKLAARMAAKAAVEIGTVALVTEVTYFGDYKLIEEPITPWTKFLVYFEVANFGVRVVGDRFESDVEVTVTIYDDAGKRVYRKEFADTHKSASRFTDLFFHVYVDLAEGRFVSGKHILKVRLVDRIKNMQTEKSIEFDIAK